MAVVFLLFFHNSCQRISGGMSEDGVSWGGGGVGGGSGGVEDKGVERAYT